MSQAMALSFNDVQFDVVDQDGQPWLKSMDIARALGYKDEGAINKIYERNQDEFTDKMTRNVNLTFQNQTKRLRIFSLRGAHLITMFARTKIAKEFRQWVLDVLDHYVNGSAEPKIPAQLTPSTAEDRKPLRDIVNVWVSQSGLNYSEAWKQVRAAFNLNNIKEFPREWVPDACSWVQAKIDALPNGQIKHDTRPALPEDPMFYDEVVGNIYQAGLKLRSQIQDEAERAVGDRAKYRAKPTDQGRFYQAHTRQIWEGTEMLMRGVNIIMRSVEAIKYADRLDR